MYYHKVEICGVNTAKLPVLKEKEKMELIVKAQAGDKEARQKMINGNQMCIRDRFVGSEEYGWVALNFVQGRLVVEKTQREKVPELIGTEVTNVVAKSDGIIRRLELVDGYPRVVPGQYVAQGQVLVSGMTLSQYERPLYSHAQAEVLAEVEKSYVYTQPLHVEPVLPQAVSKSYYKLYLPWGELSLYAQLDVPENASQRVLRLSLIHIWRGAVQPFDHCRAFSYDPLRRVPRRRPQLPTFSPDDFKL